jgi:hypothetical protein
MHMSLQSTTVAHKQACYTKVATQNFVPICHEKKTEADLRFRELKVESTAVGFKNKEVGGYK